MAGSIYQWSTTAADNGTADADVPWPEGMARRQVNDSARSLMGRVAELLGDVGGALSAGGTANGLTVTANSNFTTYADGRIVAFRATADNTGAATLNVNGIGAKAIRKMDSTGDVALVAGEIQQTGIYVVQYSAALNGAAGAWLLVNPTLSAAIYALSGLVTTDNAVIRANGTAGGLQNSGIIIDDSNNVTGVAKLTTPEVSGTGAVLTLSNTSNSLLVGSTVVRSSVNDTVQSGDDSFRWSNVYSVLGNFSSNVTMVSLLGSGVGRMGDGTAAGPAWSFTGDNNTGFYSSAADAIGISTGGTFRGNFTSTNLNLGKAAANAATVGLSLGVDGQCISTVAADTCWIVNRTSTDGTIVQIRNDNSTVGTIEVAGAATNYNTSSDGRRKKNLRNFDSGGFIDALEVWLFDWITGGSGYGVIAQDAQKVFPDAISYDEGLDLWTADYSKFVPLLLAEIKSLRARVAALEV